MGDLDIYYNSSSFLKSYEKIAEIDMDPFGERDKTDSHSDMTGEIIPLKPGGAIRGSTKETEREQETSFGGKSHEYEIFKEEQVKELYQLLRDKMYQRLEPHLDLFEIGEDWVLYYRGKSLTNRNGELKKIGVIADTLGIRGLQEMGFNISKTHLKPRHLLALIEKQIELPSRSDVANADNIELQEITENVHGAPKNVTTLTACSSSLKCQK